MRRNIWEIAGYFSGLRSPKTVEERRMRWHGLEHHPERLRASYRPADHRAVETNDLYFGIWNLFGVNGANVSGVSVYTS